MAYMFDSCINLTSINFYEIKKIEVINNNLDYENNIFNDTDLLSLGNSIETNDIIYTELIDINNENNENKNNEIIEEIGNGYFDTSNVTNMEYMFNNCTSLQNINLSLFTVTNVKTMNNMFSNCESLSIIDLTTFNALDVENISEMFGSCKNLTSIEFNYRKNVL
jgi:hypothetical protein